jgi:predicted nucleotidyltransferase
MTTPLEFPPRLEVLEARLSTRWRAIRKAHEETQHRRQLLEDRFASQGSPDTSLVVFGSVARNEVTAGSDLDWILLVDGQSVPEHKEQEQAIEKTLLDLKLTGPGTSGVFGRMVGSHDLVHNIGGEDDLNSNTTRRVLLLLESLPVGNREAFDRVRRQIIRRYLDDDRGLTHSRSDSRIPRFLLNDLTRYWRTVTVDFVYKQRASQGAKWAIRNAKLRMSRKLVFAAGLAHVFFCHLDGAAEHARKDLKEKQSTAQLTVYLAQQLRLTPLEVLARACLELEVPVSTARSIFDNYDRFLELLDNGEKREELERASSHADLRKSDVWAEVGQISNPFQDGLVALFLESDERLRRLTMNYGIF